MKITSDEHQVVISGSTVMVSGKTGPLQATWALIVDDHEVDSIKATGHFTLRGVLADGSEVEAAIHQSMVGPTTIAITHEGSEVVRFSGFVA